MYLDIKGKTDYWCPPDWITEWIYFSGEVRLAQFVTTLIAHRFVSGCYCPQLVAVSHRQTDLLVIGLDRIAGWWSKCSLRKQRKYTQIESRLWYGCLSKCNWFSLQIAELSWNKLNHGYPPGNFSQYIYRDGYISTCFFNNLSKWLRYHLPANRLQ